MTLAEPGVVGLDVFEHGRPAAGAARGFRTAELSGGRVGRTLLPGGEESFFEAGVLEEVFGGFALAVGEEEKETEKSDAAGRRGEGQGGASVVNRAGSVGGVSWVASIVLLRPPGWQDVADAIWRSRRESRLIRPAGPVSIA